MTTILTLPTINGYLADGLKTVWNFTFYGGYISRDHVKAYHKSPAGDRVDIPLSAFSFIGEFQLSITPAVPAGHELYIYRATPKQLPLVDFLDGAPYSEASFDIVAKQSVFIAAESADFLGVTTTDDLISLATTSAASASAAAASAAVASGHSASAAVSANQAIAARDIILAASATLVDAYGALGDGSTDDTAAVQAAADAAGMHGRVVFTAGKNYRIVGGVVLKHLYQSWWGYGATLTFAPTANDKALISVKATGDVSIWGAAIHGLRITSSDTAYSKTAIDIFDARICALENIIITGNTGVEAVPGSGLVNTWTGGAKSTGIRIRGRELIATKNLYIAADQPLRLSPCSDPLAASFGVGFDQSNLHNTILIAYQNPKILIDDGTIISQIKFSGYLSLNRGRQGILWHDTTTATASNGLIIEDMRSEQEENAADYVIDIQRSAATLQNLRIVGGYWGVHSNGVRLQKSERVRFESITHGGSTVALSVDATVQGIVATNCLWQAGATSVLTGQRMVYGVAKPITASPLPPTFELQPATVEKRNGVFGNAISEAPFTLADNAVAPINTANERPQGLLVVTDERGISALFLCHGNQGIVSEVADPLGFYTNGAGGTGTNVYWSAANLRYEIENKSGGSRNYKIAVFGSYGTF
jgi:hypothetical protein